MLKRCLSVFVLMFSLCSLAFAQLPLKPDEAFQLSVKTDTTRQQVFVNFQISSDYHLYASRLYFRFVPDVTFRVNLPAPEAEGYYSNNIIVPITTSAEKGGEYALSVDYQGCSARGFCYPPMTKTFTVSLSAGDSHLALSGLLQDQYRIESVLLKQPVSHLLFIFFMLGILLAFTPCVLPMLPILTGIIVGQRDRVTTFHAFNLSLVYVLGMSFAYSFAGMLAAWVGGSLQVVLQQPLFIMAGSLLFFVLALSLFEFYELPISSRWQQVVQRWSTRHEGGTYVGVFLMGLIATLMVSPCVTAPLVGVLLYISQTGNVLLGAIALFVLGLGMGLPLILVGVSAGKYLPKQGPWMLVVTKLFGLLMLAMSIWLLERILPGTVSFALWCIYTLIVLFFFVFYFPIPIAKKLGWARLGLIFILILSMATLFGALQGAKQMADRMLGVRHSTSSIEDKPLFTSVKNAAELKVALAKAKQEGKPVILDFYADWCDACHKMDDEVFADATVRKMLRQFVRLRVDLTNNTVADHALMTQYDVIAPPTILFINRQGDELSSRRIVGEMSAGEFLDRLNSLTSASCELNALC